MSDDRLLLALRANEMLVRAGLRSDWMPLGEKGSGQVDVRVMERSSSKVYWLIVQTPSIDEDISQADEEAEDSLYADAYADVDVQGQKELLRCKVTTSLEYSVANSKFHYFGDSSTEYGLKFQSENDALEFSNKIISIKSTLLKANRKRKKKNERIIRREQFQACEKIDEEAEPAAGEAVATVGASPSPALTIKEREREQQAEKDHDSIGSGHGQTPPIVDAESRHVPALPRGTQVVDETFLGPYVQFYPPNDPVTQAEAEAALIKAKLEEISRPIPEEGAPHPYAKIEGDDAGEEEEEEGPSGNGRGSSDGGEPVTTTRRNGTVLPVPSTEPVVVRRQPARSIGLASSSSSSTSNSTHVDGDAHRQAPAPATQPRSSLQTSHPKLRRQHPPIEVHQSIQKQIDEHKQWITKQEQELQFYERKREERHREQRKSNSGSVVSTGSETNGRRISNLSQIGALHSEEVRRKAQEEKHEKPVITEQPLSANTSTPPAPSQSHARLECMHCGQFYYADSNRTGDCEDGPSKCKSCVHFVSCLELASCITYWCASDEENEFVFPFQCSPNSDEDRVCCRRWTALCIAGICCPCIFCYWPLRISMDIGGSLHICGAAHEQELKPEEAFPAPHRTKSDYPSTHQRPPR